MKNNNLIVILAILCVLLVTVTFLPSVRAENKSWIDWENSTNISIFRHNVSCGDTVCSIGENIYNCPRDCSLLPLDIQIAFFDPRVPLFSERNYSLSLTNKINESLLVHLSASGELTKYLSFPNSTFILKQGERESILYTISIPHNSTLHTVQGNILVSAGGKVSKVPYSIIITAQKDAILDIGITALSKELPQNEPLEVFTKIFAYELQPVNLSLNYTIREEQSGVLVFNQTHDVMVYGSKLYSINLPLNLPEGDYVLSVATKIKGVVFSDSETFIVNTPFWSPMRVRVAVIFSLLLLAAFVGYIIVRKYAAWKKSKMRYLFPDFSKIPKKNDRSLWIGKIPDSTKRAFWDPDTLSTHALVTGSTGSGKSVTASVIIEEVLDLNIPVLIFDPTSQWTGFLKQLNDKHIFKYYPEFGLSPNDAKSFKGLLYDVESPDIHLDVKKYMNPGEVTIFNLSKLKPGEYDQAVKNIINDLFLIPWEESPQLRMVLVFDEVHRLLEKYGGKGGYVALERACREFRKWGIGLVMVSQVSADFKEAVAGNILTEIQLNTKSIEDIKKIEQKYGPDYATRITRQGIGVGMVQNPKFNNGLPWFVHFRPPLHNPHKISEEELKKYAEYSERLDTLETKFKTLPKNKVKNHLLELRLAREKLKEGHFRMVDVYLQSLSENYNKEKGDF